MPAARHFSRSPSMALAVIATIGDSRGEAGGDARRFPFADRPGRVVAVELRHLAVHQHQIERLRLHRRYGLRAIGDDCGLDAEGS